MFTSMHPDIIKERLQKNLPDATIQIQSDDHIHYRATVVSKQFQGLSKIAQHRLVYNALREELKEQIHALQLTTKTPEEHSQ